MSETFRQLVVQPDTRVIVGARGTEPEGVEALPLDLASLASVSTFAEAVKQRLGAARIDMLVLNAGAQYPKARPRYAVSRSLTTSSGNGSEARQVRRALIVGNQHIPCRYDSCGPCALPECPRRAVHSVHPMKGSSLTRLREFVDVRANRALPGGSSSAAV